MAPEAHETWARWRRTAILGSVALLALIVIFTYEAIFTPLAVALALAYILNPVMQWGVRHKMPRAVMATAMFVVVLGVTVIILLVAVPPLLNQLYMFGVSVVGEPAAEEGETGPHVRTTEEGEAYLDLSGDGEWDRGYLAALRREVRALADRIEAGEETWIDRALASLQAAPDAGQSFVKQVLGTLRRAGGEILKFLWSLQGFLVAAALTAFYLFFLLLNFDRMVRHARDHLPARHKGRIVDVMRKIDAAVAAFLRGRLVVCLIVGGLTALGLALLGVPYWYLLGVATGLAGIVPFLPIFVGLVPALLVAWFDAGSGWLMVGVVAVYFGVQGLEGWILTPVIQGKAVGLHPVTLTVALLLGYELLGLLGMIAAVPLASTLKILAKEFVLPEVDALAKEDEPPPDET